ncbi:MAG TPA: hypothetical protein DCZ95_19865 [Verrucomicrobia bacterium]|nr:hypothetical protein [Verrucomicrobiota bacterium]
MFSVEPGRLAPVFSVGTFFFRSRRRKPVAFH